MTRLKGENCKGASNKESGERDEDDLIKDIVNDFNLLEQTGKPIGSNFAKIINNVIRFTVSKEELVIKLESLESLKVKKYNKEIWGEILQSITRSKDFKTQKVQGCTLKTVGVISKVNGTLLNLKNRKNLSPNNLSYSNAHDCKDSLAHVNEECAL